MEKVEKFFYLGNMISCYGGASETLSARICSTWKKFRKLSGALVGKQGLFLKQQEKVYQCCVWPVLLCYCETWELNVVYEARLCWVECLMIRMLCELRLISRVSTDVLWDRVGVVVKINICWDINSHEVTGKKKKYWTRKLREECVKKDLEWYDLRR